MASKGKGGKGIQAQAKSRKDLFYLAPEDIHYDIKWNVRNQTITLQDHIASLAISIADLGVLQPITVRWSDNKAWVTDGFCRIQAVHLAIKSGADIKSVPVRVEDRHSNEADHVLSMLTRNSGKPLTTIEQAKVVKRLLGYNWTEKEIQAKTGFSITHVNTIKALLAAPPDVERMLVNDQVSVRRVVEVLKMHKDKPERIIETLRSDIGKAKSAGKGKATGRTANKGEKKTPGIRWAKHGPAMLDKMSDVFAVFNLTVAKNVPEDLADKINELRDFLTDNEIPYEDKNQTTIPGKGE